MARAVRLDVLTMQPQHLRRMMALALVLLAGATGAQALGDAAFAKAKLVVTFARFVQWPAGSFAGDDAPLKLCLLNSSPAVERAFRAQEGAEVNGHAVTIVVNPRLPMKSCQLLYADDSAALSANRVMAGVEGESTFTVGALDGFANQGGMVEIVHVDDALRFDVNLGALRGVGLHVSPGVLKLARQVWP